MPARRMSISTVAVEKRLLAILTAVVTVVVTIYRVIHLSSEC